MRRLTTILGLLALLLAPLEAFGFWWDQSGQCAADDAMAEASVSESSLDEAVQSAWLALESEEDCSTVDPADPSSNACFEGAEHPVSTLPDLIAQTQAERVVAQMVEQAVDQVALLDTPNLPSPNEASVEDPEMPGVPLIARPELPAPKRAPNSCSVYPDECESAPWVPILNFEASVSPTHHVSALVEIDSIPDPESRRGPPALGVGPSNGFERVLERPPEIA